MPREHSGCVSPAWARSDPVPLPEPGRDDVVVRTLRSGVSRGTEGLVFRGGVPPSQYAIMRAPFQDGDFPAPVKYGYLSVGVVEHGPPQLRGRTVFCLYPHQTAYVVPARSVVPVPEDVPPERAVLAGHGGDRSQRSVGRRAARGRPDHRRSARAWWVAASPACSAGSRRVAGDARRRRSPGGPTSQPRSASTSRCRPTPPTAAIWSCTRAQHPPGSSCRSIFSSRRARSSTSAGTATTDVTAVARGRVPLRPTRYPAPARSERSHRLAAGDSDDGRSAGARSRVAARSGVRCSADRILALRRAARRDGPARRRVVCRRSATPSPTAKGRFACSASPSAIT